MIDCCYCEKEITNETKVAFIYVVPFMEGTDFYNLFNHHDELDIYNIIKEETNILYYKIYNYDKSIQVVTSDNYNIYFNIVNGIYEFPHIDIIYRNVEELKLENSKVMNLVSSFESFTIHLNFVYREIMNNNKYVAFKYLGDAYGDLLGFLGNYYLNYSPDVDVIHYDFSDVLKLMDKRLQTNFKRIMDLYKVDNVKECSKLMIWFIDEYIGHLTINVVSKINIDYYDFVKGLF